MAGRRYFYNSYVKYLFDHQSTHNTTDTSSNYHEDVQKYDISSTPGEMGTIGYQWNHLVNRKRTVSLKMPLCVGIN